MAMFNNLNPESLFNAVLIFMLAQLVVLAVLNVRITDDYEEAEQEPSEQATSHE